MSQCITVAGQLEGGEMIDQHQSVIQRAEMYACKYSRVERLRADSWPVMSKVNEILTFRANAALFTLQVSNGDKSDQNN